MNSNKKRFVIKSKVRFTAFLMVILLGIVNLGAVASLGIDNYRDIQVQEYVEVSVCSGDTLWDIAEEYMSDNMDIRQAIYVIQEVNDLNDKNLVQGQILKVPVQS